jgi:DNA helicase-2/ATP-dependent DNA helicase PcrA
MKKAEPESPTTSIKKSFNDFVKQNLNPPQQAAVKQKDGALLVVAGAGSGKTRVITSRIANLVINEHVEPRSIVALTFTNKAASEMRERLVHTFGTEYRPPFIGTFHSYCLLLLRTNQTLLTFPRFTIMDADDQLDLIKKITKKYALNKQATPSQICHHISNYKNKTAAGQLADINSYFPPYLREIYLEYETEKANAHCFDFDDLILQVLSLLQNNKQFKEQMQKNVRHILIDEYQDTSHVQHQLLLQLALDDKKKFTLDSLCAVGDEDQSIYSWRGATVANILRFQQDFAPVTTVKIEQNYRSVQPILEAANNIIANNKLRNPKNLWSTRQAKQRILQLACQSGDQEAEIISSIIKSVEGKKTFDQIAILYRTHFQSRTIEESLIHHAIPYRIIGGIRFYERKEVKDLLAYLRLLVNPYDKISLLRVINTPARGLGQKFEDHLLQVWLQNPLCDFVQLFKLLLEGTSDEVTPTKQKALKDFLNVYKDINTTQSPSYIIDTLLERIGYISYLSSAYDTQEAQTKIENVQEFAQAVLMFERKYMATMSRTPDEAPTGSMLETFLHEVALLQEKVNEENSTNFVQLMTLHAAKGLEFDTVIIAGLEEGLLPNTRSLNTNEELEEERRLMYVGMTRAKEHLIMTSAWSRFTFGHITDQAPSRFLSEVPRNLINVIDLDQTKLYQAPLFFERWFKGESIAQPQPERKSVSNKPAATTRTASIKSAATPWIKNQVVIHAKFGPGIVTDVEKAPDDDYYITALFKTGKKKILSQFLNKA